MMASMAGEDGTCWPSHKYLADHCMCSRRTIVNTLKHLEVAGYISTQRRFKENVQTSNMYTVNTGVQNLHRGSEMVAQPPSEMVAHNTVTSINSNRNPFDQTAFDQWWKLYPKKVGKKQALAAWKRLRPSADLVATIMTDTKTRQASDRKWIDGFIKDPVRYITHEQWTDEIDSSAPKTEALPNDMEALDRYAFEKGLYPKLGMAPQGIRNAFEFKTWIQERI